VRVARRLTCWCESCLPVLLDFKSEHGIADELDVQQTAAFVQFAVTRLTTNGLEEDYVSPAELE
jgi:hypothetical protein